MKRKTLRRGDCRISVKLRTASGTCARQAHLNPFTISSPLLLNSCLTVLVNSWITPCVIACLNTYVSTCLDSHLTVCSQSLHQPGAWEHPKTPLTLSASYYCTTTFLLPCITAYFTTFSRSNHLILTLTIMASSCSLCTPLECSYKNNILKARTNCPLTLFARTHRDSPNYVPTKPSCHDLWSFTPNYEENATAACCK